MEYLKKALSMCCKDCCTKRKSSDDSGVRIILPTNRSMSSKNGSIRKTTFTYLAQPNFYIPMSEEKYSPVCSSPTNKRKLSAPPILTQTVPVQPFAAYAASNENMTTSAYEPMIHIEEHIDEPVNNHNNNSTIVFGSPLHRSNESVGSSSLSPMSPTTRPRSNQKRLSVAQIAASHSRRSSMSSFDISRDEVDSDMYGSSELLHDINSNGKLCYSVSYDPEFEQLTVNVICAKHLWSPEQNCIITDSCVKVSILPPVKKKPAKATTAVQKGNSSPIYDERITMDGVMKEMLHQYTIKLTVFSIDRFSKRRKLGLVNHLLTNISSDDANKKIWSHIYTEGEKPEKAELGNLMLTMCYQPTDNQVKLNVVRATQLNIKEHDNKQYDGIYVKIALIGHGKILSKEKTKLIQPAIANPVFDEMFTFTLPDRMIDQSCIIVSVNGKNSYGKRTHIGYVSLGPPFFSTGTGLEQWTKMLSAPFTMIGKWHSLSVWSKKDSSQNVNECNMF